MNPPSPPNPLNPLTLLRRLATALKPPRRARGAKTSEERAARKYWDRQIADDHERRGVSDKHP
jgi:hypothetical protein